MVLYVLVIEKTLKIYLIRERPTYTEEMVNRESSDLQSPKDIGLCVKDPDRVEGHLNWVIGDIAPEKALHSSVCHLLWCFICNEEKLSLLS